MEMCSPTSTGRQKYAWRHLGATVLIFGILAAWFVHNPQPHHDTVGLIRLIQIWDLFEGQHLFYGRDPKENKYLTRAHLAEMIALMGPPPLDLLKKGKRTAEFFDEDGKIFLLQPLTLISLTSI